MKIVTISDTHGYHRELDLPEGDILLHAGDICNQGNKEHVSDFLNWFASLDYKHKVFIRGNHDWDLINDVSLIPTSLPDGIIYLNNTACVIDGIRIFGVPYINENEDNYNESEWNVIPKNIDILMTHNPPYTIQDKAPNGLHKGSNDLKKKVLEIKPKLHLFGHIHVSHGSSKIGDCTFINPSNYDASLGMIHRPAIIYQYK